MKKKEKFIIISIILLAIIVIILLAILLTKKREIEITDNVHYDYPEQTFYVEKIKDSVEFYTVEFVVNTYENMIINKESEEIYSILNKNYIDENQITTENVLDNVEKSSFSEELDPFDEIKIEIESMYSIKESTNTLTDYYVKGYVMKNDDYSVKDEINLMVKLDSQNSAFSVAPNKYLEQKGLTNVKEGDSISVDNEEIIANDYNSFEYQNVTDEEKIWDYFSKYKNNILYGDIANSYNLLDPEYREARFTNLEVYQEYIKNNIVDLIKSTIQSFQVSTTEDSTRYICLDQYGNYYIFNETAVMEFTLVLDTYTIDLPEFTEKYTSGTEQQKVALNIDKFMQAINSADYKYAYNCLADSFKDNYFKTQEEFEIYAKENFYEKSTVAYNDFNIQEDIYTYSVTLTDKETNEQMNKTFIMKLDEGTNFELSFNR